MNVWSCRKSLSDWNRGRKRDEELICCRSVKHLNRKIPGQGGEGYCQRWVSCLFNVCVSYPFSINLYVGTEFTSGFVVATQSWTNTRSSSRGTNTDTSMYITSPWKYMPSLTSCQSAAQRNRKWCNEQCTINQHTAECFCTHWSSDAEWSAGCVWKSAHWCEGAMWGWLGHCQHQTSWNTHTQGQIQWLADWGCVGGLIVFCQLKPKCVFGHKRECTMNRTNLIRCLLNKPS